MLNDTIFLPVDIFQLYSDVVGAIRHLIMFFMKFPNTSSRVDKN